MKVSIIVPIYKVEKYLHRCINSIVNQSYKNIEIILVDDGSPDNCPTICDEWAKKDSRIKVIHKENEGLGYARNSGLDISTGEYVMFVDSDDYIRNNSCELALKKIIKDNSDMCVYFLTRVYNNKSIPDDIFDCKDLYCGKDEIIEFLCNSIAENVNEKATKSFTVSACKAMYSKKIIDDNNLRFVSEREFFSEDGVFRVNICQYINQVSVLKEYLYFYVCNEQSLTKNYRAERFILIKNFYNKLNEFKKVYNNSEYNTRCIGIFLHNIIACIKMEENYCNQNGKLQAIKNIKRIINDDLVREAINNYPIKKMPLNKRLFFYFVKLKLVSFVFLMAKIKKIKDRKNHR